jgi:hypothetical protein
MLILTLAVLVNDPMMDALEFRGTLVSHSVFVANELSRAARRSRAWRCDAREDDAGKTGKW